jgi:hypothetical protein
MWVYKVNRIIVTGFISVVYIKSGLNGSSNLILKPCAKACRLLLMHPEEFLWQSEFRIRVEEGQQ